MYLNLIQIAESFGVSEKVVEDWIRNEGLPHVPDRGRLIFDRAQVATWAAAHGLAAHTGFLAPEHKAFTTGVPLDSLLRVGGIWRDVAPDDARAVLRRIVEHVPAPAPIRALLARRVESEEGISWAPVGGGLALPHPGTRVTLGREAGLLALVFLNGDLHLGTPPPDGQPLRRLLFFVAPSPRAHLDILGALSRLLVREPARDRIVAESPDEVLFSTFASEGLSDPDAGGGKRP